MTRPRAGVAGGAGDWTQVRLVATPDDVDLVADVLWGAGAQGIEERTTAHGSELLAGFDSATGAATAVRLLQARGHHDVEASPVTETGLDAWREFARPVLAGRFWLVPTWITPPDGVAEREVLWIDPGPTFGSGSHPTTQLVVEALCDLVREGDRVIDVGCGSGVLAVAAARLGAASAVGIDVDPACRAALEANAARNSVSSSVSWSDLDVDALAEAGWRAEVVVANLLAPVIADHAPALRSLVAPGGTLVVSGLLEDRWETSVAALEPGAVREVRRSDGWVAVVVADASGPGR